MNQPSRAEKFVLPEGVRKLTFTRDTKVSNAGTFIVQKEDHTLGNPVRMQLHRDPNVVFAGYQVPHPSDNRIVIKVGVLWGERKRVQTATVNHRSRVSCVVSSQSFTSFLGFPPCVPQVSTPTTDTQSPPQPSGTHQQGLLADAGDDGIGGTPENRGTRRNGNVVRLKNRANVIRAKCAPRQMRSAPNANQPNRPSPPPRSRKQVAELSQKFADEVRAFKAQQGDDGY